MYSNNGLSALPECCILPVLFCFAVDDAIRAANKQAGDGVATAYIDDNTAAVKVSDVPKVIAALKAALAPTGASIKCRVEVAPKSHPMCQRSSNQSLTD